MSPVVFRRKKFQSERVKLQKKANLYKVPGVYYFIRPAIFEKNYRTVKPFYSGSEMLSYSFQEIKSRHIETMSKF